MMKDWQNYRSSLLSITLYSVSFAPRSRVACSSMLLNLERFSVGDNKSRNKATNYRFNHVKSTRVLRSILARTFLHSLTQISENIFLIKTNLPKPRIDNGGTKLHRLLICWKPW